MKYKAIKVKHFDHWIWFENDKVGTKDGYFTGRDGVGKDGTTISINIPQELIEGSMMSDELQYVQQEDNRMKQLFLEDLKGMSETQIKKHISEEYGGEESGFDYGEPNATDINIVAKQLEEYIILVAYESVGSWGCDSSSYFLLKHKTTGVYQEFSGSHCSCYGFEGQFDLQEAPIEYLKSDKFYFYCGGYDDNETENQNLVKEFVIVL